MCDRTFASLDSVATRLLGGAWAGYGLRYLGLWSTPVVSDYLAARCPKLVLQDPNDEIIANVASLKNGVATHLALGDSVWYEHSQPQEYVLAHHLDQDEVALPHSESAAQLLEQLSDTSLPLTENMVAHLFACVMVVAKRSTGIFGSTGKAERRKARSDQSDKSASPKSASPGGADKPTAKSRLSHALSSTAHTIELINSQGSINTHSSAGPAEGEDADIEAATRDSSSQSSGQSSAPMQFSSQREFLSFLCSISLLEQSNRHPAVNALTPYTKLLGQALRLGYDGFRAWLCALIVWNHSDTATPDCSLPPRRASVQQAATELFRLVDVHHEEFLASNCGYAAVTFLRDALAGVAKRVDCAQFTSSQSAGGDDGDASYAQSATGGTGQCCNQVAVTATALHSVATGGCSGSQPTNIHKNIGHVVTLHCGHNGWPAQHELVAITDFFARHKLI